MHAEYLQTSEFTALTGADTTDAFVLLKDFPDVESLRSNICLLGRLRDGAYVGLRLWTCLSP
jgi:hypothetical protein